MSKETHYPTATPRMQRFAYRRVRGEPHMVEVMICKRWFKLTRNFFNQHFERDSKRP